jgi:hypothetical protein
VGGCLDYAGCGFEREWKDQWREVRLRIIVAQGDIRILEKHGLYPRSGLHVNDGLRGTSAVGLRH